MWTETVYLDLSWVLHLTTSKHVPAKPQSERQNLTLWFSASLTCTCECNISVYLSSWPASHPKRKPPTKNQVSAKQFLLRHDRNFLHPALSLSFIGWRAPNTYRNSQQDHVQSCSAAAQNSFYRGAIGIFSILLSPCLSSAEERLTRTKTANKITYSPARQQHRTVSIAVR